SPKYFNTVGEQIVSSLPVERLLLRRPTPGSITKAFNTAAFRRITTLELGADEVGPEVIRYVVSAPVEHLHGLVLTTNFVQSSGPSADAWFRRSEESVALIAMARRLSGLRRLDLRFAGIGQVGAMALAESPGLKSLRLLLLTG